MTNTACACSTQKLISSAEIAICQAAADALLSKAGFRTSSPDSGQSGVFTEHSLIGHYYSPGHEEWKHAVVSVPFSFGVLAVHVEIKEPLPASESDLPALAVNLFVVRDGKQPEALVSAELLPHLDGSGKPAVKVNPKKGLKVTKKYDWRCLRQCAPSCLSCLDDVQCWVICAGACVISCAL